MKQATYRKSAPGSFWWCNSHQRVATHIQTRYDGAESPHCDPSLGGIMIPCVCVEAVLAEDEAKRRERI